MIAVRISISYSRHYFSDVRTAAKGFIALGLESRKSVAILGFNSPEWFIADLAAVLADSFAVGIYATNSPDMCKYMANHCKANIIVVEDEKQLEKILKVKQDLPGLCFIALRYVWVRSVLGSRPHCYR